MKGISRMFMAGAAALLLAVSPVSATEWGFGGFAVGGIGASGSVSGAGNLSKAFQHGSSTASAESQSFGQAESGFGVGVGTLPDGSPASGAYGNFAGGTALSGSRSTASTTANGNGFSGAGSVGGGFGATVLGGVGGGGFAAAGN